MFGSTTRQQQMQQDSAMKDDMSATDTSLTLENSSHGDFHDMENAMVDEKLPEPRACSKRVRFDETRNQYHQGRSGLVLTAREHYNAWYGEEDMMRFRLQATRAAELLFAKRDASMYKRWKMDKKDLRTLRSSVMCKKALSAAYKECNRIKTEEDFGYCAPSTVDRKCLIKAYESVDDEICLIGLEGVILMTLRTESSHQIGYILEAVETRMGGREAMNANPVQRDQMMRMFSQYISLPSRVFVHELAMAQAEIVQKEASSIKA